MTEHVTQRATEQTAEVDGVAERAQKKTRVTAEQHRAALVEEWSRWVAVADIHYDGALAYTVGHPVPHANVMRHRYHEQGLVAKANESNQPADPGPAGDKE